MIQSAVQKRSINKEYWLDTKNGDRMILSAITSIIQEGNHFGGVILIARDITQYHALNDNLVPGKGYIIDKSTNDRKTMLLLYSERGYEPLVLTRGEMYNDFENIQMKWQDESQDMILDKIEAFVKNKKKSIIYIDKVNYLLTVFGFKECMILFYRFNEILRTHDSIGLIELPKSIAGKELDILEDEFYRVVEEKPNVHLDNSRLSLLRLIDDLNRKHSYESISKMSQKMKVSRITVSNWLGELEREKLISLQDKGNRKIITISEKGKEILS